MAIAQQLSLPDARYTYTCAQGASGIGYSVPGTGVGITYAIINEYQVLYSEGTGSTKKNVLLGYIYTTWGRGHGDGGTAYFVGPYGSTDPMINGATSILLGPNGLSKNKKDFLEALRRRLLEVVGKKWKESILKTRVEGPCFRTNWNGTY